MEAKTLGKFFTPYIDKRKPLLIGSVKSNIGHTESAAGVAGLIKVLLMMRNGKIVPSLHIKQDKSNINKKILFEGNNIDIAVKVTDWDTDQFGERVACVNSFGFGGTNCHAIIVQESSCTYSTPDVHTCQNFISISGIDSLSLAANLDNLRQDLTNDPTVELAKLAYTSLYYRDTYSFRTLLYGRNIQDILEQIQARKQQMCLRSTRENKLVFVYCGVGTAWKGMCKEMMQLELFQSKIIEIDKYLEPLAGIKVSDWFSSESSTYDDPFVNHVCIFACQVALTHVWTSWKITPDYIVGQSVGEVAAAYASGIVPLNEAVRVIYHRSRILAGNTGGTMMVLGNMPIEEIESLCSKYETVSIAVYSSPVACTLSGSEEELENVKEELQIKNELEKKNYFTMDLNVNCAYHSAFVENCKSKIVTQIGHIRTNKEYSFPVISTVTGHFTSPHDFTAKYWANNVRSPVLFYQSLQRLLADKTRTIFLEIGPKQVLRAHFENVIQDKQGLCLPSMNNTKELDCIYKSLTSLYEIGYDIDWTWFSIKPCVPYELPAYKFTKSRSLFIPEKSKRHLRYWYYDEHQPHLYIRKVSDNLKASWEIEIDKNVASFVFDHKLSGTVLVPGATYIDVGFYIGSDFYNRPACDFSVSVSFKQALIPSVRFKTPIHVSIERKNIDSIEFVCQSKGKEVACGNVSIRKKLLFYKINIESILYRCSNTCNKTRVYEFMRRYGFEYGESLSSIEKTWNNEYECLASVVIPEMIVSEFTKTKCHPAVIDLMMQSFAMLQNYGNEMKNAMPKSVKSIQINSSFQKEMFIYTQLTAINRNERYFNSYLLSKDGFAIVEVEGLCAWIGNEDISNLDSTFIFEICQNRQLLPTEEILPPGIVYIFNLDNKRKSNWIWNMIIANKTLHEVTAFETVNAEHASACVMISANSVSHKDILDCSLAQFMRVKEALLEFSNLSISCPIFMVTTNTQKCSCREGHTRNVIGSELWGLVRTARLEGLHDDIRLLDVDENNFKDDIFLRVISLEGPRNAELCLTGSDLFLLTLKTTQDRQDFREVIPDSNESAILSRNLLRQEIKPYFRLCEKEKVNINEDTCGIRLSTAILVDNFLCEENGFVLTGPLTQGTSTKYFGDVDVIAFEGIGRNITNEEVVFCFPVTIKTPFAHVPKQCTILKKEIPNYEPGKMLLYSYLKRIAAIVPKGTRVFVLKDKFCTTYKSDILARMLYDRKCKVVLCDIENFEKRVLTMSNTKVMVLLCYINARFEDALSAKNHRLQLIVTLKVFASEVYRIVSASNNPTMRIATVDLYDILQPHTMAKIFPRVCTLLKKSKLSEKDYKRVLHLQRPFRIISLENCLGNEIRMRLTRTELFRKSGCYIVVGGLTGLGWLLLQFLAELGAGILAIFSRRLPSIEQTTSIKRTEIDFSCRIHHIQTDISDITCLKLTIKTLEGLIGKIPIRGIFQGAGQLSDAFLRNQTHKSVKEVFSPKVLGSWNLHICSLHLPLDFFVMHSSVTAFIGNEGQSNYAAANSFMDSLALYRQAQGLCGQSINWGPLSVGMSHNKGLQLHFQTGGLEILSEEEIKRCFLDVLMCRKAQYILGSFNWNIIARRTQQLFKYERVSSRPFREGSMSEDGAKATIDWTSLDKESREETMRSLITRTICNGFLVSENDISKETSVQDLGVDSMSAQSFINSFYELSGIRIPIIKLLDGNITIEDILQYGLANLPVSDDAASKKNYTAEILDKAIAFTQMSVLSQYRNDRKIKQNYDIYDIELNIGGLNLEIWKDIIKEVLKVCPELRKRYIFSDGTVTEKLDSEAHEQIPELIEIPISELSDEDNETATIDIDNEHPIKFKMVRSERKTYIRFILHKVISDLQCMAIIFKAIQQVGNSRRTGASIPVRNIIDIPASLKASLLPKWKQAEVFWQKALQGTLTPVVIGNKTELPSVMEFKVVRKQMSENVFRKVEQCLKRMNITIFNLSVCMFHLILYLQTAETTITTSTIVDIRGHVPALKEQIVRCQNEILVLTTIQANQTVQDYFMKSSQELKETMEHCFFPEELIFQSIQDKHLRNNINRHFVIMDNLETINDLIEEHRGALLRNIFHRRSGYETKLFTIYDMKRRHLSFEFGCSLTLCGEELACLLFNTFLQMLENIDEILPLKISDLKDSYRGGGFAICKRLSQLSVDKKKMPATFSHSDLDLRRKHPTQIAKGNVHVKGTLFYNTKTVAMFKCSGFIKQIQNANRKIKMHDH